MLPPNATAPQPLTTAAPGQPTMRFCVGIDTSRYGHYAVFLGDNTYLDFAHVKQQLPLAALPLYSQKW